ncbi:mitochondrial assembly of ribosomal large subunit protein 1 [Mugil cephalus]|uniref:mitochondrial assembly of ribosomal large subunit protein 1 n=1 Tax=Mugil cephalus TaxID=48193 RepID=UPI001FB5C888|nr:mitochondrial assembly of ribosomal large subunit protein 1 [Mugil cephalus]
MNAFSRSGKLLSSVFRSRVLLEQNGVYRSVCATRRAQRYSLYLPQHFTANSASCQHCSQVVSFRCHFDTKRCFSQSDESKDFESSVVSEEESHEIDDSSSSLSQRRSETFSLDVLVSLLRQENAVDLCVIKVPEEIKYAEYFIVVSGVSPRHVRAMAFYALKVYKFLKNDSDPEVKIEGRDAEDWMCIDFGNMVVHFMMPETRELYELEKLWTLRAYDEKLKRIPPDTLPEDFMLDPEVAK